MVILQQITITMKKLLYFLTAAMLLVTGCNKTPEPEINISGSPAISLADGASSGSFTFTANNDWTVDAQDSWIHVSPASGSASDQSVTVTVTCDPNPNDTPRSSKVIIKAGGITKEITVTQAAGIVNIPVTGISISPSEATLEVGETLQLTATVTPANASDKTVVWSRDLVIGDAPFEITADGLVTAKSAGQCNATATCGGVTANCLITVLPGSFTVYVYDGLDWGSMIFYCWDADQEDSEEYAELEPDGTEEVSGHTFYKFEVPGEWTEVRLAMCFSDEEESNWSQDTYGWCNPDGKYYLYITGPYDADHNASLLNIEDPASFDPQPYVPPGPELPEGTLFYENFDSVGCLDGWTMIDADGDGFNWRLSTDVPSWESGMGNDSSTAMLCSQSYDNATSSVLTPDNWTFTPAITLGSNNQLSLWLCGQDADYAAEHLAVYMTEQIPSGDDIASGCTILMEGTIGSEFVIFTKTQTDWLKYEIPIPEEFNGKTVYFGFRHFISTDMFVIDIDDVVVTGNR